MLSESARMSSAGEARFRIDAPNSKPRHIKVIALHGLARAVECNHFDVPRLGIWRVDPEPRLTGAGHPCAFAQHEIVLGSALLPLLGGSGDGGRGVDQEYAPTARPQSANLK